MSFLIADPFAQAFRAPEIAVESTGFNLEAYQPECYQQLGIALPQRVSKAVPKRQAEFLAGRHCAALALQSLGFDDTEVHSGENRIPQWPRGSVGSISHTAGMAVAVAARQQDYLGIGVDCEQLIASDVTERIYDTIAIPADSELLARSSRSKEWFLTLLFSAKESLFKALYPTVGRYFGFDKAQLLELKEDTFVIGLAETLNSRWQKGQRFTGYYLEASGCILTLVKVSQKTI